MGEEEVKQNLESSQLEKKIIKQIEYYFGDKNLPRDKFLQEKILQDDGWVTIECLTTFNRLKVLSSDADEILTALGKSKNDLVELDNENKKIRRKPEKAVPKTHDAESVRISKQKTLIVSGFPTDWTLDQLEEYFEDKGEVIFIKMRRGDNFAFKGSCFIEFATPEMAKTFLEMKDLKIGDNDVEAVTRDAFYQKKNEEEKGKGRKRNDRDGEEGEKDVERKATFIEASVLHFKGAGEETSREDLRSLFGQHEEVAWIDFVRNDQEGHVRFQKEGGAQRAIDAMKEANDGKLEIKGVESVVRVLEGEEEEKFWVNAKKEQAEFKKQREQKERERRQKHKGKRKGYQGKKRTRNESDQAKSEANGDKKEEAKGDHKRFDDEEAEEKPKQEEGEPQAKKPKQEEGEPQAKQARVD